MTVTGIFAAGSMMVLFIDKFIKSIKGFSASVKDLKKVD